MFEIRPFITLITALCSLFVSQPVCAITPQKHLYPLFFQACRWTFTLARSVCGRSRTVPVSTAASRTCTSTTSFRISPRPRWNLAWYRAASPARSCTASMASANLTGLKDQYATANQAGLGRTATSRLWTRARGASMFKTLDEQVKGQNSQESFFPSILKVVENYCLSQSFSYLS